MDASSIKPIQGTGRRFPEGKVQNLPLLCVEAICKFTPTSKLVRIYSTAVPLPGANWNYGLEVVLKKRLPFSLSQDLSRSQREDTRIDALFDSSGAKVASIKHPEAFQFSSVCEFVENAAVPFRIPDYCASEARSRFVISGQPLLPHLPNINKLTLIGVGDWEEPRPSKNLDNQVLLLPTLMKVLPQLEAFAVEKWLEETDPLDTILVKMLPEVTALKRLDVYLLTVDTLVRAATADSKDSEGIRRALAGVCSMQLRYMLHDGSSRRALQVLGFLSGCCTQLTHLSLMVEGQLKPYLVSLRALVSLNTLGLEVGNVNTNGMSFGEEEYIHSVLDLRLVCNYWNRSSDGEKAAIASLFPNINAASLYFESFAAKLCEKQAWPKLEKLSCFNSHVGEDVSSIAHLLACAYLPAAVDLSAFAVKDLERVSSTLTAIYQALQNGPVKTLLLRGPMHREALPRLRAHMDLNGEDAKITAWKDRDLGEQTSNFRAVSVPDTEFPALSRRGAVAVPIPEFPEYSDVRIVGSKENGDTVTIRVVHQFAKKKDIFG